jgi:membrane protein
MDSLDRRDHTLNSIDPQRQRIWDFVSAVPIRDLWNLQGIPPLTLARRTFHAFLEDNLLARAAELGYYFIFALFPTLVSASAILGLAARSASDIYVRLLNYLSIVVPHSALGIVLDTFNQTTQQASSGKVTFGIAAAIWSASVGFSAIQDTLNAVYKVKETRPYWKARGAAMLVTVLLALIVTATLASMLLGTVLSHIVRHHVAMANLALALGIAIHLIFDVVTLGLIVLLFAVIYYFAPDIRNKRWHWLTPGSAFGILGWILASLVLRVYLHFFDNYSVTYGSLGAVIILLTWFYLTGLMLLLGAEINSEIEAATTERRLKATGTISPAVTTDPEHPISAAS